MSKRDLAFAGAVAITIVCFCALLFWPGTFGGRLLATYDGLLQAIPAIDAPARLWEPNLALGFPLYADPDEAFFYPLAMVMRALHSHFNLYFIAPIAIAQAGVFTLAWSYTRMFAAAVVAALTFSLGGFMMGHFCHSNIEHPAAWSVVFLACLEVLRLRPRNPWPLIAAAFALAMTLVSGQPQVPAFLLAITAVFIAAFAQSAPGGGRRFVARALGATVLGIFLAGILLVPEAQLAAHGTRGTMSAAAQYMDTVWPAEIPIRLILPHFLDPDPFRSFIELSSYCGVLGLMLAIVGASTALRDRRVFFWCMVAVAGLVLSTGDTFGIARFTQYLPIYNLFRIPGRHAYEFTLAIALLAAFGTAIVVRKEMGSRVLAMTIGALVLLCALAANALLHSHSETIEFVRTVDPSAFTARRNPEVWLSAALIVVSALALITSRLMARGVARIVLPALVLFDMSTFAWASYWNAASTSVAVLKPTPLARLIAARMPGGRLLFVPGATEWGVPTNVNLVWGIPEAQIYSNLGTRTVSDFLQLTPAATVTAISDTVLDLADVRFVAAMKSTHAVDRPGLQSMLFAEPEHWRVVPFPGYDLFENRAPLPEFWIASHAVSTSSQDALATLYGSRPGNEAPFPYRTTALTERPLALGAPSPSNRVIVRSQNASSTALDVTCAAPCLVVQSATAYPGWIASIDRAPARLETVDVALRGVVVPAGSHHVQLEFHPIVLTVGTIVTSLGLAGLFAILWFCLKGRRGALPFRTVLRADG